MPRSVFPQTVAQMHFHAVFGEAHFIVEWQSVGFMGHQSVQILRDESAQAIAIAIGRRRVDRAGANQNQEQHGMLHRV